MRGNDDVRSALKSTYRNMRPDAALRARVDELVKDGDHHTETVEMELAVPRKTRFTSLKLPLLSAAAVSALVIVAVSSLTSPRDKSTPLASDHGNSATEQSAIDSPLVASLTGGVATEASMQSPTSSAKKGRDTASILSDPKVCGSQFDPEQFANGGLDVTIELRTYAAGEKLVATVQNPTRALNGIAQSVILVYQDRNLIGAFLPTAKPANLVISDLPGGSVFSQTEYLPEKAGSIIDLQSRSASGFVACGADTASTLPAGVYEVRIYERLGDGFGISDGATFAYN